MNGHFRRLWDRRYAFGLVFCLLIAAFFATYHLTESPQTWFDEGIFLQLARNALVQLPFSLRVSPTELVPAGAISTVGFPVIAPVSASFALFGIGILQARAVMVLFILLLIATLYAFARAAWGERTAFWATVLVATHAPVYGNGKNVLGEIPGLFLFFAFLHFVHELEQREQRSLSLWAATGLAAGLFMATKPNFLLLAPVLLIALWLRRKTLAPTWKELAIAALGAALPVFVNILFSFGSLHAFISGLHDYGMPGLAKVTGLTLPQLVMKNALSFFHQATPMYALGTVGIWALWLGLRLKRKIIIPTHELLAFGFVLLTMAYYLKMPGFYRYLFTAQVIAFPYAVASGFALLEKRLLKPMLIVLACLAVFQTYQVLFSSWVAGHYASTRTTELTAFFQGLDPRTHVFIYHAPEVATFVKGENYSQYFDLLYFNDALGKGELPSLDAGEPDLVIVSSDSQPQAAPYLTKYQQVLTLDGGSYLLYARH